MEQDLPPSGERQRERELVDRCRAGDERAWATLYDLYAPRIGRFVRALLGPADAEDVVQRVFLESLGALGKFRGDARLSTWLHGIAANVARSELRSRGRRQRKHDALADEVLDGSPTARTQRPDRQAEARERLAIVHDAVQALDWRLRTVWVLREIEGMDVEETAQALGIPTATVRTRHHRARSRIVEALLGAEGFRAPETRGERILRRLRSSFLGNQEAKS